MLVVPAGKALADTLEEALVMAYMSNPSLESGRAALRAADELVPQALAGYRPDIFVLGSSDLVDSETSSAADDRFTNQAQLSLSQSLYAGGATRASVRRAEHLVTAERASLLALEQDVFQAAVEAYIATWSDRAVLDLAERNRDRLERQLQATRDRFRFGDVARTDVEQAVARYAGALSDVEQAKADLAASAAAYRDIIGIEPGELLRPEPADNLPESESAAHQQADANPQIYQVRAQHEAALAGIEVAKADLLPSLDLNGALTYTDEPSSTLDWSREARVGLDLSIPLYQGGAAWSRVREARQTAQEIRSAVDTQIRAVQREVTTAWRRLAAARAAVEALTSQVEANEVALQGVQEEALVGQRTVLDVLDAEQELFQARVDLVRAQASVVSASFELKAAVGELTVVGLDLPVEPYNPEAYYQQFRDRLFGLEVE